MACTAWEALDTGAQEVLNTKCAGVLCVSNSHERRHPEAQRCLVQQMMKLTLLLENVNLDCCRMQTTAL